jgi:ATP-dependent helicase/nuclease subunit B
MNAGVSFQPLLPFGPDDAQLPRPRLLDELARACRERPLEEKILLAPSLSIGHQLTERLARAGTAWIHLRVETVRNLAHGLVGSSLVEEGLALLSRAQSLALVEQACAQALGPGSYFGRIKDRPGLHRALQSTFDELRAAGISAATLPARAFPDPKKAAELGAILSRYEQALAGGRLVDRAGVLRRAIDRVRETHSAAGPFYLLPSRLELSSAERELVEKIAGERLVLLSAESPEEWGPVARSARLFRATGEENEVREVFRRLLAAGTPWDEAELLYTDPRTYPALVYELAQQYGVACTFSGGIAVDFSRPGQAALGFLEWIGGDFEEERVRTIVAAGAVDLRPIVSEGELSSVETARALRAASIGWGRHRHLACLDRLITELARPEDPRRTESPEDPEAAARRAARRERSLAAARAVRSFVEGALRLIPEMPSGQVELPALARSLRGLVAAFARVASGFDGTSREALIHLFAELEALPAAPLPVAEAARRLTGAVRDLHVDSGRPRPGTLHVADYRSGGYSGRRQTFVLGLDERRHPGSGLQDPVLLDDERRDINETVRPHALAIHGDRPTENTLALRACVARLNGDVTFGFSCWNLAQASEQFPAPFLLDAHREIAGNPTADYTELLEALAPPAGFLPSPEDALDEMEWALSRLRSFPGGAAADSVRAAYPWLRDGKIASIERASDRFTVYDGGIGPVPELDPRITQEPISCSRIQTLARCPYAYFLHDVLGVAPPEDLESDPRQWLDPKALGSLLHDVFYRFFTEISARGEKPSVADHAARLEQIAEQLVVLWRERIPPRSAAAFALCREAIAVACRTLLREEEEHCRRVTPRYFEVPFGLPRAELDSALASRDSVELSLGSSRGFRLRGRIDRIDEAPDGTFQVWDYKTGGTHSVSEQKGLDAGRQAQYALYAAATEQLLARAGQTARVSRSGYFFPGPKGQGQRIEPGLDVDESSRVINVLFDLLATGSFLHTPRKDDCNFCDFQRVCGNVEAVAAASKLKIEKAIDPNLLAFREMRDE